MRQVDRRALFTSGAAAALLAATGIALADTPRSGGRLRLAVAPFEGAMSPVAMAAVFDTLTEVGQAGVLKGELAVSWEADSQARAWQIGLRDDVLFHDGGAFTAADAAASLTARGLRIRRIEAVDSARLRIELDRADPDLPYRLADPALSITRAAHAGHEITARVGTGLYEPAHLREGRHFLGRRRRPHYKDGLAGWADEVEVVTIPDPAVRAEALRDGYVDVAELPDGAALPEGGRFQTHPGLDRRIARHLGVGVPHGADPAATVDAARIAERWWLG